MTAASEARFTWSVISTRRLAAAVLPLALMVIGVIVVEPSKLGWWFVSAGLALSVSGLTAWVWMAGLGGAAVETGDWTQTTQHRALMVFAPLARLVGPLLIIVGLFF